MEGTYNGKIDMNDLPWYGSKASVVSDIDKRNETCMIFQSKEPIIPAGLDDNPAPEKTGGHHGISVEHPTSYTETLMHLFKGNIGSGLFAMGDAIKNAGLIVGPIIVLILGIVCVHCQHLLLNAAKKMEEKTGVGASPDFAETVDLCFKNGPTPLRKYAPYMGKLVNIALFITQLGFCCVYFVFISTNIKQVADYYGYPLDLHIHMLLILFPILLTSLVRNLKFLAPLSTVANICIVVGIVIIFYYITQDIPDPSTRYYVAPDIMQFPLFFGTALFAFEGIGLVLPLKNEMSKPQQFQSPFGVLNMGMVVVIILYTTMGCMAYLKFGDDIGGSVTLNLPEEALGHSVKIIISLAILFTYALQFYIPIDITFSIIQKKWGPMKHPIFAELAYRTALVIVTFALAELIPYLNLFISLIGAMSSTALALLFPPILELVIMERTPWRVTKNAFILFVGGLGCITGTYESIRSIVNAFNE